MGSFKEVSDLLAEKADDIKGSDIKEINIDESQNIEIKNYFIYDGKLGISLMDEISEIKDAIESELGSSEGETTEGDKETTENKKETKKQIENRIKAAFPGLKFKDNLKRLKKDEITEYGIVADYLIADKDKIENLNITHLEFHLGGEETKISEFDGKKTLSIDIGEGVDGLENKLAVADVESGETVDYTDYETILAKAAEPLKKYFGKDFAFGMILTEEGDDVELSKKFFDAKILKSLTENVEMIAGIGERMQKNGITGIYVKKESAHDFLVPKNVLAILLDLRQNAEQNKVEIEEVLDTLELRAEAKAKGITNEENIDRWVNLMNPWKRGPLWKAFSNETEVKDIQDKLRSQKSWKIPKYLTLSNWNPSQEVVKDLMDKFNKTKSSNILSLINEINQLTPDLKKRQFKKLSAEDQNKFEFSEREIYIKGSATNLFRNNKIDAGTVKAVDKLFDNPAADVIDLRSELEPIFVTLYEDMYKNEQLDDSPEKRKDRNRFSSLIENIAKFDNVPSMIKVEDGIESKLSSDEVKNLYKATRNQRQKN